MDFDLISKYFENTSAPLHSQKVEDKVIEDLDFHLFFEKIDYTCSKIGQQFLYNRLRWITMSQEILEERTNLSHFFSQNIEIKTKTIQLLNHLNNHSNYYVFKFIIDKERKEKNVYPYIISTLLLFLSIILSIQHIKLSFLPLIFICAHIFFHYRNKMKWEYEFHYTAELFKSIQIVNKLQKLKIPLPFPDKTLNNLQVLKNRLWHSKFERWLQEDILIFVWIVLEFIKIICNFEAIFNELIIRKIQKDKVDILKMFEYIGEIDCAISTSTLIEHEKNICTPRFINSKELKIKNITHPLVENCIPNDLNLVHESLVITGSNMSGKTTFIRAIGLNIILAQTIHIAFATQFEIPFSNIHSSIRNKDNVIDSRSYYLDEILTIKDFIFNLNVPFFNIILFDEILKGTNSLERIAISKNILNFLNNQNCIIIASTHDFEIASFLQDKNYKNAYFEDLIEDTLLKFDYKIQFGLKETRNAIKLLKVNQFPTSLISKIENSIKQS